MPRKLAPEVRAGEWHNSLLIASRDTLYGHRVLPGLILQMLEDDAWRYMVRPIDGAEFTHETIEEWVRGEPWGGLGYPKWEDLYTILRMDGEDGKKAIEALIQHGGPVNAGAADAQPIAAVIHAGPGRGNKTNDNVNGFEGGNSSAYTIGRLKRDRPDLAERVVKGELKAHAAAIEAGFRERTVPLSLNPEKAARTILRHYAPEEVQRLIRALIGSA